VRRYLLTLALAALPLVASAQTQGQDLPEVSITISPSSASILSGQDLNVWVTLTNSSGRSLFIGFCDKRSLGLVRVQEAAGKSPPGKPGAGGTAATPVASRLKFLPVLPSLRGSP